MALGAFATQRRALVQFFVTVGARLTASFFLCLGQACDDLVAGNGAGGAQAPAQGDVGPRGQVTLRVPAVFAAVPLVTCVFAVQGVCAEPPADVVVSFVDRPEPGYYSRTVIPTLAAMARAMPDRTVTGVRLLPDDPSADLMRLRPDILVGPASVYMELELNYGGHAIATRKTRWADNPSASVDPSLHARHALLV